MNIRHTNIRKIAAALSAAALAGTAFAVNPIVTHKYSADPNAFVWKDRLYVVCSHDLDGQKGFEMNDYVLMSTDDLVNWTDHGDVFTGGKDVKWCWNLYAPGAAVKDGKVYLYYPNSGGPIGVAVADRPEGPYTDPLGKHLIGREMPGCDSCWVFDPAAFVDDDGKAYLYFGGNGDTMARAVRLNDDMVSAQFPGIMMKASKDGKEATVMPYFFEASYMHKHNGKYYFSYSANFPDRGASIDYAIGDSPLGPFRQAEKKPLLERKGIDNSLFVDADGKAWMVYVHFDRGNTIWLAELEKDWLHVRPGTQRMLFRADQPSVGVRPRRLLGQIRRDLNPRESGGC